MTHGQWQTTIKSKVDSSWNLDRLLPHDLDFFILLSSVSSTNGFAAQSNYTAACVFQDVLAQSRCANGQRGVSIGLSIVRDAGYYATSDILHKNDAITKNVKPIDMKQLLATLSIYCDPNQPPSSSHVLLGWTTPADHAAKGKAPPEYMNRPLFAPFQNTIRQTASSTDDEADASTRFKVEEDADKRTQIVLDALVVKLARAMSISPDQVDAQNPPTYYSVDSLSAMNLRHWAKRDFGAALETSEIFGATSVAAVVELIVSKSTC
ncbi:hypothetical protein CDD81_1457 [Ophiocordyceps australis]|uniref:Carrier domain-containing protein n=1 Tax=Ophiocordyceps australis TaxID=1399860 RepID=A0A2C5YE27_9HYPO|nr:hypothetical protein CDD81_1457 [Ophiocordyceps australis]